MEQKVFRHPETRVLADALRLVIAARRDRLVAAQRGRYSHRRAALIDRLGDQYHVVLAVALDAGLDEGLQ